MSAALVSAAKEKLILWWIVGFWTFFFSFSSLCTAIVGALYGMRWAQIETQDKFVVCLIIFINWSITMMAFFSKAAARIQKGELPLSEGEQLVSKTTLAVTSKTSVEEKP